MKTKRAKPAEAARRRLEELGGQIAQDFGLGRIVGQLLAYLYFQPGERSLDQIEDDLGLSKSAASVAARQLAGLGLVKRVWVSGDKRSYYRTADNIASAVGQGLLGILRRRLAEVERELHQAQSELHGAAAGGDKDSTFMAERVARARELQERLLALLDSPLLALFSDGR